MADPKTRPSVFGVIVLIVGIVAALIIALGLWLS
jgi:hypothetical protein